MARAMEVFQDSPIKQNVDCDSFNAKKFTNVGRNGFSNSVFVRGSRNRSEHGHNHEDSNCYLTSSSLSSSSCSSSEFEEDASSSSPSFSPLFHLSELMSQLPIKRGLSKYYDGKSESFTSLASVGNLEDMVKKRSSCSQRIKSCKINGWGLDDCRKYGPKATITKRNSTNSSKRSFFSTRGGDTTISSCRPSLFIKQKF